MRTDLLRDRFILIAAFFLFCGACGDGGGPAEDGEEEEIDALVDGVDGVDEAEETVDGMDPPMDGEAGCGSDDDCDDGDPCTIDRCDLESGVCFTAATISTCENGDGCCPEGCDGSVDDDCPPPTLPRLVVADEAAGVLVWNNADELSSDAAADAVLGGLSGEALGLALYEDRLIVSSSDSAFAFYIYDDISRADDGASYTDRIGVDAVGGAPLVAVAEMSSDASGNLWAVPSQDSIWLLRRGASLGSGSPDQVEFSHPYSQISSMAMDDAGDKLLGGQISGAGVIAWDDPMSRSGTGNTNDWTLHVLDPSSMVIHAGRLYVGCWNPPYIQIWDDISSITEPAPPHATMASGSGLVAVWHLSLRDDVLAACTRWMDTAKVNIYLGAGSLSGDGTPDFEITHSLLDDPKKAYLGADETLYVMDGEGGILIFRDALSAPALATELTAPTKPSDFLLIESW